MNRETRHSLPDWYVRSRERSRRYWLERLGREPTFEEAADDFVKGIGALTGRLLQFTRSVEAAASQMDGRSV